MKAIHEVERVLKTMYVGESNNNQVIQAYFEFFLFSNLPMHVSTAV
jgi:hypothetical protein